MDQFYSMFIKKFGQPTSREIVPDNVLSKYSEVLPKNFLEFWKELGWCSFDNGRFWTVNPDLLNGVFADWIGDIPELGDSEYITFARGAFGDLYAWGVRTGSVITVQCTHGFIMTQKDFRAEKKNKVMELQAFFATSYPDDYDLLDEVEDSLFEQAVRGLGPLRRDEIYGFEPLLVLGGSPTIENVKKFRMDVHLEVMRQFTNPVLSLV